MDQIIKAFIGIFFLFVETFAGIGITTAAIDAKNAEEFVTDAAQIIEERNFSDSVINGLTEKANKAGYELTVNVVDLDDDDIADMAELSLKYDYSIKFINVITKQQYAKAYAK